MSTVRTVAPLSCIERELWALLDIPVAGREAPTVPVLWLCPDLPLPATDGAGCDAWLRLVPGRDGPRPQSGRIGGPGGAMNEVSLLDSLRAQQAAKAE